MMAEEKAEFDFSRNDKFYSLTIPRYSSYDDVVMYEVHLKDLVNNKEYINFFRFKDLKEIHEELSNLKVKYFSIISSWNCLNSLKLTFGARQTKIHN